MHTQHLFASGLYTYYVKILLIYIMLKTIYIETLGAEILAYVRKLFFFR
jgi:hypothetical protein